MKYYNGNETGQIPGILPEPYYWWETGALFDTLIDYWAQTGDDAYNAVTKQGLLWQTGENNDFLPANQTEAEGNDDQGVWALAALSAAERGFPSASSDQDQWLALAQNVFDDFAARWDAKVCGGGLRWQIFTFNAGYDYKNSASNGVFFDLAARLYLQTKNGTYARWASDVFAWEQKAGLISDSYQVFDGVHTASCGEVNKVQSSMNAGIFLHGAAAMYNATASSEWKTRVDGLLKGVQSTFVKDDVLVEAACEEQGTCSTDMQSYKSYLVRGLKATTEWAPYTRQTIQPLLLSSAQAAAAACSGPTTKTFLGRSGTACGFSWLQAFDGKTGVGEQLNALSAVISTISGAAAAAQGGDDDGEGSSGAAANGTSTAGSGKPSGTSGPVKASVTPGGAGTRVAVDAVAAVVALGGVVVALL
ncbi:glycoside hydrolase family 76 protein [Trichoderma citrinoviride]|uniref:Mannan endo-1,6-alpha-mannosidase n=1 Tax=Trichoderma citrinoviride TaxID=58853 RepID=A0A2T4BH43_9HYPO|nr:glycoside hydrolase family 76 protein [Trichoderma citrinoviride]PTB68635.1 glycoside hydrolase family 76 protein [Trichoderma citrinoviride]